MTLCFQLFQRAISQSGTALVPWAFQPNPRGEAEALGRRLGLSWSSTQNLVDQIRNIPFQRLVDAQGGWLDLPVPRGLTSMEWVPCVEPAGVPETRFLTAHPETLMRQGNFLQLPAMIGYTSVSEFLTLSSFSLKLFRFYRSRACSCDAKTWSTPQFLLKCKQIRTSMFPDRSTSTRQRIRRR